jgi:hypothetical protein
MRYELVGKDAEWALFQSAVLAVAWGPGALAPRAVAEADGEGFAELSMVVGLLAWLAWDVETNIAVASQRNGFEGLENEQWYALQLLAVLAPLLIEDATAWTVLEESVARTPRYQVDPDRWVAHHRAALEHVAAVDRAPEVHGSMRRAVRPGDLAILQGHESPRVRVVLNVLPGSDIKIVVYDPDDEDGVRAFVSSRIATLPWRDEGSLLAQVR